MENKESMALTLPDKERFIQDLRAINEFQQVARANMIEGADWGVIPGTGTKPTLLKPGAEKIAKLLGLSDQYIIVDRQENWDTGFFRFLIKCQLIAVRNGVLISEGLGECNSKESKYAYRWVSERDLPPGTDKANLVSQTRHSRSGSKWTVYRFNNEDIYSQVNTLLKMAKKRALVDAALSAGRLSQVFTQDIEDMEGIVLPPPEPTKQKPNTNIDSFRKTKAKAAKAEVKEEAPETNAPVEEAPVVADKLVPPEGIARDPSTVTSLNAMFKACFDDFKLQPKQVTDELGVSSQSEIIETPAACYIKIRAIYGENPEATPGF